MILSKYVDVVISGTNLKHFEGLWYTIPRYKDSKGRITIKRGTKINVKVWDLLPSSNTLVEVQCEDCWEKRQVQYADIAYRKNARFAETWETLCSSCANHRMSWENNGQYKHWCNRYCEYRYGAKEKGIEFWLSIDEFKTLVAQPCYYCWWYSIDRNKRSRWNWIDRVDSKKWYFIDNCVPCCWLCNKIKWTMPIDEFKTHIKNLYNNLFKNEI